MEINYVLCAGGDETLLVHSAGGIGVEGLGGPYSLGLGLSGVLRGSGGSVDINPQLLKERRPPLYIKSSVLLIRSCGPPSFSSGPVVLLIRSCGPPSFSSGPVVLRPSHQVLWSSSSGPVVLRPPHQVLWSSVLLIRSCGPPSFSSGPVVLRP
ncbi:hypothetical protein EYF80_036527 [Liparis tanakae]|uniref:Uncharacterized protein n=1 Tax=Liparis tanakae TaxID=230148 RepID=A0A4Z2GKA9_9TELE|nr:hypothetical protein EYF80_036527 [Liparis tanakae]